MRRTRMNTLGYIVQEYDVELLCPIMNSYTVYTSLYDAVYAADEKCQSFVEHRDETLEGPFHYYEVSERLLQASGSAVYFRSRDVWIWISAIYQN